MIARLASRYRIALLAVTALLLAGFALLGSAQQAPQVQLTSQAAEAGPEEVATLADAGTSEVDISGGPTLPERAANTAAVDNLFAGHSWYTPPAAPVRKTASPIARKPVAPPLPYKFIGSYEQGENTMYFLTKGDLVYDVKIGDVLDETYSVDSVTDGQLNFTYLPLHTSQGLRLGENP